MNEEILKNLIEWQKKAASLLPYEANLVSLLGANENTHSQILIHILNYPQEGEYPLLKSFLSTFLGIELKKSDNPKISFNKDFIDILIATKNNVIIIENKINWAADQHKQLERYLDTVLRDGHKMKEIRLLYLTDNGTKTVSEDSLSKEVRKKLNDHFLPINYMVDILPWLKEAKGLLPNKEVMLTSLLTQYIDYLESRFGLKTDTQKIMEKNMDNLNNILSKELGYDINKPEDALKKLNDNLNPIIDAINNLQLKYNYSARVVNSYKPIMAKLRTDFSTSWLQRTDPWQYYTLVVDIKDEYSLEPNLRMQVDVGSREISFSFHNHKIWNLSTSTLSTLTSKGYTSCGKEGNINAYQSFSLPEFFGNKSPLDIEDSELQERIFNKILEMKDLVSKSNN